MTDAPSDKHSVLLSPSTVEPLQLDLRRVIWVGVGLWGAALVVFCVRAIAGSASARSMGICAAGLVLGFIGLVWERRHSHAH